MLKKTWSFGYRIKRKTEEKDTEKVCESRYRSLHSQVKDMCAALWPTRMRGREESICLSVVNQV